jgi:hypothetical protein
VLIDNIHCDNLIGISLYLQLVALSLWCCDYLVIIEYLVA